MANPIAVPGTVVSSGAAVSPGGAQGPSAVSANANNKATLGSDSLVLVQGTAAGIAATTHAQTVSGDDPQLTNARTPTAHQASHVTGSDQIPLASASTKGLLNQTSGNTTDFIDGTNNSQALQPVIWSARLRSFNSLGNPNFEVTQRNTGSLLTNPANGTLAEDRWAVAKGTATLGYSVQSLTVGTTLSGSIVVPGTNFAISKKVFRVTLTTQQASLAAGDLLRIWQTIEGTQLRELSMDVHSVSLLVQSSVAGLKFSVALRDNPVTQSLVKLCTIPSANTWTLIPLANLPVFPSAGNFSVGTGLFGYELDICLACGTTSMAPAADVWQSGSFVGAPGMSNFAASPVNSTLDIACVVHEPGALCTTLQDCPFQQNYDDCLRYFCKSYDYDIPLGALSALGLNAFFQSGTTQITGAARFPKPMAKTPTLTGYNHATGAVNSIRFNNGSDFAITSFPGSGKAGFYAVNTATLPALVLGAFGFFHYIADTGW